MNKRVVVPSADERLDAIDRLIEEMTLEEKAGQLSIYAAVDAAAAAAAANPALAAATAEEQVQAVRDGRVSALFNGSSADWHRTMQQVAVTETRLKIPLLFAADVIHGFRTIFPVPLAEAASFDPDLAERTARAAAVEATSAGLAWNFAPMVDVSRDARWGRGVEGAGEDVLLGSRFAAARVRGFQGTKGLADREAMLATPKHFVAYGAAIGGLDYNSVDISERTLREIYFPPFEAAFEAGALATMASFNDVAGIPAHANRWLLKDVLQGEWGFEGFVVSDFSGDVELIAHGFAADEREAARKSVVLLKNDGVLPLPKSGRKIALIGPFADGPHDLNGPWVLFGDPNYAVSLEQGIRTVLADGADLKVVRGCEAEAPIPGGIDAAVAAAADADLVILALGEAERMSGEAQSRTDIAIPAPQLALTEAVASVGKPVVTVLRNGRALVLDGAVAASNAILVGWFLGVETGNALADILFGDYGPSGRLPVSFPQRSGQSPFHYDRKTTGRPPVTLDHGEEFKARYREILNVAAYPFGHGLTYGNIVYDELDVGGGRLAWDGALTVGATVRNRGIRAATELVQLYIRDRTASITRPIRQLKDWKHVTLAPGASARIEFTLRREDLTFVGPDLEWIAEPGLFDVWIAPSAEAGLEGRFSMDPPA